MQLTLYTDYSLRVLIYLGIRPHEQATITEIATHYKISRNHLVKVVHNLGALGFIRTVRGRGGGLVLARDAKDINIGEVVRHTEPNFDLVECFNKEHNSCPIEPACKLIRPLKIARDAFLQELDKFTLNDVLSNRQELAFYLKIEAVTNRNQTTAKSR